MKKKVILVAIAMLLLCTTAWGQATNYNIFGRPTADWFSGNSRDTALSWMRAIDPMVGTGATNIGTGSFLYVDSNVTVEGDGSSWTNAKDTINEAYDLCTANNGDIIYVAQGHAETLGTLTLDTEGVTIIGIGKGEDRPEITFDTTTDKITISAASNTISNISFLAGVHVVATAIEITADGDYTTIIGCDFPEPGTNTYDFMTAIQLTTAADYVTVANCTYKHADAVGPVEFIDGGAGAVQGLAVIGNYLYSEFSAAAIFSDQTDLEVLIADNVITNMTTNLYAIQMGASATGWLINNKVATDTYATAIEAGGLAVDQSTVWVDYGQTDTVAVPYFPNATGVARMSATEAAEIEAEVEDALEVKFLDNLAAVAVADEIVNESFLADITSGTQDWSTFVASTDSLEAISNKITALTGYIHSGTNSAATSTEPAVAALIGYGNDYFNTDWVMVVLLNADAVGTAPEGDVRDITDYVSTTGTFTIDATSAALASGDIVMVARKEAFVLAGIKSGTGAYPTGVANDSILAMILSKGAEAAASTYVNSTDSLEMISDKLGAFAGTAGASANESLLADMVLLQTDIQTIITDTAAMDDASGMQTLTGTAAVSTTGITGAPTAQTLADTLHKDGSFTFDNTTDSLEAIADEQEYSMTITRTAAATLGNGTTNLFVVSAPVEVTSLVGIVANALKTVANDCKFIITTTVPSASVDLTSAVECSADAAGVSYILGATVGAALVPTDAGVVQSSALKFIAPAGTIGWNSAGTYDADDSIVFYIKYKPLISGARVTASP
jgi:hypothetical protein